MLEVQKPKPEVIEAAQIPEQVREALAELAEAEAEILEAFPGVSVHKDYQAHGDRERMAWRRATLRRESAMANLLALGRLVLAWRSRSVAA
jgi:hypothetical protein